VDLQLTLLNLLLKIVKNKERLNYILETREVKSYQAIKEDNTIIYYVPIIFINKQICESHNLNYKKVFFIELLPVVLQTKL